MFMEFNNVKCQQLQVHLELCDITDNHFHYFITVYCMKNQDEKE